MMNIEDDLLEEKVFESVEEFVNSSTIPDINTEYIIYNKCGNIYYIVYNFEDNDNSFNLSYSESHYTKFWESNIQAIEYLNLKKQFMNKYYNHLDVSVDNDDECHPHLSMSLNCDKDDLIKNLHYLEKAHLDFDKKINILENNIDKLISNFEF